MEGKIIMEFNEKLQELRKKKGLTQEDLAELLYVSRTAISKWESGRGYPNIDSLKAVSKCFGVTVDELLSSDELLIIAEEDTKHKEGYIRDLVFGLLDCSVAMFLFLPFFGQNTNGMIVEASLLTLANISKWLLTSYFAVVICTVLFGILTLALQNSHNAIWIKTKSKASLILNVAGTLLFIVSTQPYAAAFLFIFLLIKVFLSVKL